MVHQNGEAGDVCEVDMVDIEPVGVLDEDTVIRKDTRERLAVTLRNAHRFFESWAVAVDGEVGELDPAAMLATQNGAPMKGVRHAQDASISGDGEIVRAVGQAQFGRHGRYAGRQMKDSGAWNSQRDKQRKQTIFAPG
jgi:hypothetical protein